MSLILEALKRAERERYAGKSAMLTELPSGLPPESRSHRLRWAVIGLGVLAAAVVVALALRRTAPPPAAIAPPPATEAPAAPVAAVPTFLPTPAPVPGTEAVSSLDELTSAEPEPQPYLPAELVPAPALPARKPAAAAAPAPAPGAPPAPALAPAPAATQAPSEPGPDPVAAPATPAPMPEPDRAPAEPPVSQIPPALTQAVPLRRFRELPDELRAEFPPLTIDVHVYERTPTQRFAIVNGRRYREGELMIEGPQLVEVVRDGLVLDWRGERFLYSLGR